MEVPTTRTRAARLVGSSSAPHRASGLSVLRLDPRDTGLSGDGGETYTLSTMADDVAQILTDAGIGRAHVIGVSMGGMILVDLATRYPDSIGYAVFLAAMSPDPAAGMGPDFFAAIGADPVDATLRAMGSPSDAERRWVIEEQTRAARRSPARPEAGERHQRAAFRFGWPELERLGDIRSPALVIHGTADRVLPLDHAIAFEHGIADARLTIIDGMGHLPTQAEWHRLATVTVEFLGRDTGTTRAV